MLQVAGRQSRIKHKALLVSSMPPTDTMGKPEFDILPNQLPGDAFERMCSDPEITRAKQHFIMAVGSVLGLVLLATIIHLSGFWRIQPTIGDRVATAAPTQAVGVAPQETSKAQSSTAGVNPNAVKKLNFRLSNSTTDTDAASIFAESQKVLVSFLAAETIPEKLSHVNNPSAVESQMKAFYQKNALGAVVYERIEAGGLPREGYLEFRIVMKNSSSKFAAMVSTPSGPKLDWPSFALTGEIEWAQMREQRPQLPVLMRVLAKTSTHFEGHFKQTDGLRCVQLLPASDPAAPPVYGYVPKGSDLDKNLDYWLKSSGVEMSPLTVRICYSPESSTPDQAWITDLVVAGWFTLGVENAAGSE
jgi:hypothetical protein